MMVRLWRNLTLKRRRQFILLAGLMLFSAFAEIMSLGAVLPFLGVLVAQESVLSYPWIKDAMQALGVISERDLTLPLTIAFASAATIAGATRILLLWFSTRLAFDSGADLSAEVYRRTLYQPYRVHIGRNSSEIVSVINNKVNDVVFGVLMPMLTLFSSIILLVAISFALLLINPMIALTATIGFCTSYLLITIKARRRLEINSRRIAYEQTQVLKALQDGLGGIRDVLLEGAQSIYCNEYNKANKPLRRAQGSNIFIALSPRFAIEASGMVLIAVFAYSLSRSGSVATVFPVLGALALGAQRLLPALQQSYAAWVSITGNFASLSDTLDMLDQKLPKRMLPISQAVNTFQENIRFKSLRFRYTDDSPWVLDGLSFTIRKGARIGLVGSSGCGKSTTMDLLLGLLTPCEGELLVDGLPLSGILIRGWQESIAHVSQSIYLTDTTLAENIAFGVQPCEIDMDRVRLAARQAHIADFIESRPEKYGALIGERGIRLSGGQRQRIGIARALYKQASVLIFDEATSALDNTTEQLVMNAIEQLHPEITIILIAHRMSTLIRCDTIFQLENGRVLAQGTYEQLLVSSPSFRLMALTVV
jgi:ATP-binding cassette subfamily B protein